MVSSRVRYISAPQRAEKSGTIESVSARLALEKIARATAALSGAPLTERLTERKRDGEDDGNSEAVGRGRTTCRGGRRTGRSPVRLVPLGRGETEGRQQHSAACGRCRESACAAVCPTGALATEHGGQVRLDRDRCLGCGYCAIACPHGVPVFPEVRSAGGRGAMKQRVQCADDPVNSGGGIRHNRCSRQVETSVAPRCGSIHPTGLLPVIGI